VQGGNEDAPTFTLGNQQITFVRIEGAVDANGQKVLPYYLSTTEVTVGLFGAMMQAAGVTGDVIRLPDNQAMSVRGPQLWQHAGNGLVEADSWLKRMPQRFDDYPADLLDSAAPGHLAGRRLATAGQNPQTDMPMQHVPPEAAMFIAAQMGCRLPTYAEWKFAAAKQPFAPGLLPNLRDATWEKQLAHVSDMRAKRLNQLKWPDAGGFTIQAARGEGAQAIGWTADQLAKAGVPGIPNPFNDQYLWLRAVKPGPVLSDLYGNVAELVMAEPIAMDKLPDKSFATFQKLADSNNNKILVVGGSFMSPPEWGLDQQVIGLNDGFTDTGFRLAFAASKRLVVDRLKDLMEETKFIALAGPTTAPAN
jgi:hypothetical protein